MTFGTHLELFTELRNNCSEDRRNELITFLVNKYNPLIHRVAWLCTSLSHSHAYNAALKGFMDCIEKFDASMGVDFAYRARLYMRSELQKEYRDDRIIHIPHNRIRDYEKAVRDNLFIKSDDELTVEERALVESLSDILPLIHCSDLESPIGDDGQTIGDLQEQNTFENPDEAYYMGQLKGALERILNLLPEDEKLALIHFNGLFNEEVKTAREVGTIIGRSHQGAINARIRGELKLKELCLDTIADVENVFNLGSFK